MYRREIASSSMIPEDVTPAFIARTGIKFDLNIYLILKPFFIETYRKIASESVRENLLDNNAVASIQMPDGMLNRALL